MESIKWFSLLLMSCIVASCANEVVYKAPDFKEIHPKQIKVLNDEYMFRHAHTPMVVDSLLITGTSNDDNYIAIFNRHTGDLIKDFGRKGSGPNELNRPTAFSVDKLNRLLYVYDWGKQALVQYDLQKVLEEGMPPYKTIKMAYEFERSSKARFLKDSLFYAPTFNEGRMFVGVFRKYNILSNRKRRTSTSSPLKKIGIFI